MSIQDFYSGCNIFITGGTGFMGKILIEKLLRSCTGINHIYVLMRHRKEKCVTDRVKDMMALPMFDRLKIEKPGCLEMKLVPVMGDLAEIRLGLSDNDYNMLGKNISIVFHVAATVRFDEPFQEAIIKNIRGTREVVRLAKQMNNLKAFLHVSTTYCNCNREYVEEKIYDSSINWKDVIEIAETIDPKLLEICKTNFLGLYPNTYTFTKFLAEHVINEETLNKNHNDNMPMVIFRPSIVIPSVDEPVPGWTDTLNGPIGLLAAFGKGLTFVVLSIRSSWPDFMPVDLSIKAMIVAAYHRGMQKSMLDNQIQVYHSSSAEKSINIQMLMDLSVKYFISNPFEEVLWRPSIYVTKSKTLFTIIFVAKQFLLSILVDNLTKVIGKPMPVKLMKLQQKIYVAQMALSYFSLRTWKFVNTNFISLLNHIPDAEQNDFNFAFEHMNEEEVFIKTFVGTQKYLFNTDPKKKIESVRRIKKLIWIDKLLKIILFGLVIWTLFKLDIFPSKIINFIN